MLFAYFFIFLFPLAVYLLVLGTINRRVRPFMISGSVDALMLAFGISGILLWIGPALLSAFHQRGFLSGDFDHAWTNFFWIWVAYYGLVICGQALMVLSRKNKTVIYNVDAAALENVLARILADKGYRTSQRHGLIAFERQPDGGEPATTAVQAGVAIADRKTDAAAPETTLRGAVDVDAFVPLRNVTLNWHVEDVRFRRAIETELNARLADAVTAENPSATWLLGLSGVVFGCVFLGAVFVVVVGILRGN